MAITGDNTVGLMHIVGPAGCHFLLSTTDLYSIGNLPSRSNNIQYRPMDKLANLPYFDTIQVCRCFSYVKCGLGLNAGLISQV